MHHRQQQGRDADVLERGGDGGVVVGDRAAGVTGSAGPAPGAPVGASWASVTSVRSRRWRGSRRGGTGSCLKLLLRLDRSRTGSPASSMSSNDASSSSKKTTPEHERAIDPAGAVKQLARTIWHAVAIGAVSRDHALLQSLPSLLTFAPLDPSMAVTDTLVRGTAARIGGRVEDARELFDEFFEQTTRPDTGLGDGLRLLTRWGVMYVAGLLDAAFGLESSLAWAKEIESLPTHQVNAQLIRMVYCFWRGEIREADEIRERVEVLRIQNSPRQFLEGSHLLPTATMHAASDDLTRIKQVMDDLEPLAKRHRGWAPVRDYASGEYHRIRGDHAMALQEIELSLSGMQPGAHQLWPNAAGAHVRALFDLERYAEASARGRQHLLDAERAGHRNLCAFIRMPLALTLAKLGQVSEAERMADDVIEGLRALGSKGVLLGCAYETRARVAIDAGDHGAFASFSAQCAEELRAGASRVLTAKYEKLKQAAALAEIRVAAEPVLAPMIKEPLSGSQLTSMLESCRGPNERAQQSLQILLCQSGVTEGFLFTLSESGPELSARVGDGDASPLIDTKVREYLDAEIRDQDLRTVSLELESSPPLSEWAGSLGERFRLVLLSHAVETGSAITGVAVAVVLPGVHFMHPGPTATQLSRILLDSGDVVPAIVAA